MAFYRTVLFDLKPETAQEFEDMLCKMLPDARAFDGCQHLAMLRDSSNAAAITLYMIWDTQQHYKEYMAWRKETKFPETIAPYLAAPPSGSDYILVQD